MDGRLVSGTRSRGTKTSSSPSEHVRVTSYKAFLSVFCLGMLSPASSCRVSRGRGVLQLPSSIEEKEGLPREEEASCRDIRR